MPSGRTTGLRLWLGGQRRAIMSTIVASAPAKVILFGEHAVNRHQAALATAVPLRVTCRAYVRSDHRYSFGAGERVEAGDRDRLLGYKAHIDALRAAEAFDQIRLEARRDFFAPARYVLAHVVERVGGPGLDVEWQSELPVGSGLGSGAAATSALVLAALCAAGNQISPAEVAFLAWQGDVIAHGGVASGLDSGASALGGLTRYTLEGGPTPLAWAADLLLVIGDTRVQANTAEVNTRVRRGLAEHPARAHLFAEIGLLVRYAEAAIAAGELHELGRLMNLNHLVLEKLEVSCPELQRLVEAALEAGALGAKLSGSGGGGIMVALVEPTNEAKVAAAIEAAGGRALRVRAGAPGARIEG